jgi:hypothetical protein
MRDGGYQPHHAAPFGSTAALRGTVAALAAVFPEKIGNGADSLVVGRMEGELPLAPDCDEAGIDQTFEVVVHRRPGDVQSLLQVCRGNSRRAGLNDSSEERETGNVAQRCELVGVALQLSHFYISSAIDLLVNGELMAN